MSAHLLIDLDDALFIQDEVHHEIEALDRERGIYCSREHRTPERVLAWIDDRFGGTASYEAAAGGIWLAHEAGELVGFAAFDARGLAYDDLRFWMARDGVGIVGPLGVVPAARGRGIGRTLLHAAAFSTRERGYRQAIVTAVDDAAHIAFLEHHANARFVLRVDDRLERRYRTTVLASGNGSNFAGVLEASAAGRVPFEVTALVANRPRALALERARDTGVAAHMVAWDRATETRDAFDGRVIATVAATSPDLVLLLGWMHVLPATFLARFPETLNIHPAMLPYDFALDTITMPDGVEIPAFRGAHAFDEALAAGLGWSGATMHRVGVAVDRGRVYARAPLHLPADRDRAELELALHTLERRVTEIAIGRWARERP